MVVLSRPGEAGYSLFSWMASFTIFCTTGVVKNARKGACLPEGYGVVLLCVPHCLRATAEKFSRSLSSVFLSNDLRLYLMVPYAVAEKDLRLVRRQDQSVGS